MSNTAGNFAQFPGPLGPKCDAPPNTFAFPRSPNQFDTNASLGDFWLNTDPNDPNFQTLYYLADLYLDLNVSATIIAEWIPTASGGGGGALSFLTAGDGVQVMPIAGNIDFENTAQIVSTGNNPALGKISFDWGVNPSAVGTITAGNQMNAGASMTAGTNITSTAGNITATLGSVTAQLDLTTVAGNVSLPATAATGLTGVITVAGGRFIHARGADNTFVGTNSGNFTLTGNSSSGFGSASLQSLTTGNGNTALGVGSLNALTTGSSNVAVGGAGTFLTSGSLNTLIGTSAGSNYTGAESANVILGPNTGILGESNTIRIGNPTAGPSQQTRAFIAGVANVLTDIGNSEYVTIDLTTGQLGSSSEIPPGPTDGVNFLAYQTATAAGVLPAAAITLQVGAYGGANGIFTTQFNNGGGVIVSGDGVATAFSYTVPVAGVYLFECSIAAHVRSTTTYWTTIITPTRSFETYLTCDSGAGAGNIPEQLLATNLFTMAAGDAVTFQIRKGGVSVNTGDIDGGNAPMRTTVSGSLQAPTVISNPESTSFFAYQSGDTTANITGDGTVVQLGAAGGAGAAFLADFNLGGGTLVLGDGAGVPLSYAVPVSGVYNFHVQTTTDATGLVSPTVAYNEIVTSGGNIYRENFKPVATFSGGILQSTLCSLTAGDIVTFRFAVTQAAPALNVGLIGGAAPRQTYVYGYLQSPSTIVPVGDTNFMAYQTGNMTDVTGDGTVISLGASGGAAGIFIQSYNNGAGVLALGDGAGTPLRYTIPDTGVYEFTVWVENNLNGAFLLDRYYGYLSIVTPALTARSNTNLNEQNGFGVYNMLSRSISGQFSLTAGDNVTFTFMADLGPAAGARLVGLTGGGAPLKTYVYGKRIS